MTDRNGREAFTDETWAAWGPLIEEVRPRGTTPPKDMRRTMAAIFWRHQNGAKWRSIPAGLARNGLEPMGGDGAALLAFQRREYDRWGEVVRQTGMKAEG